MLLLLITVVSHVVGCYLLLGVVVSFSCSFIVVVAVAAVIVAAVIVAAVIVNLIRQYCDHIH